MIIEAIKEMCEGDVEEVYCAFSVFFEIVLKRKTEFQTGTILHIRADKTCSYAGSFQ